MRKKISNRILTFIFLACLALSLPLSKVFADSKVLRVVGAEIIEKSATVDGKVAVDGDANISSDITFKKLGDFVKLKIELKNADEKDHVIKSVANDNKNPYVAYSYEETENVVVKAGESFDFVVMAKYQNEVTSMNERTKSENVRFLFEISDVAEPEEINLTGKSESAGIIEAAGKNNKGVVVPDTSGKFSGLASVVKNNAAPLIIAVVSAAGLALVAFKSRKKVSKIMAVFVATVSTLAVSLAASAMAMNEVNFVVKVRYEFYDKLVVAYEDANGETHEKIVKNGEKVKLTVPEKVGYTFLHWEDESGSIYDAEAGVVNDVKIKPVYRKNNYVVKFDKNAGDGEMTDLALVYDEAKNLTQNTFTRADYKFIGWNTQADGKGEDFADLQEVKNLTSTDGDVITLYAQWEKKSYVCEAAKELHVEPCKNSGDGGCANNGGYALDDMITYGTLSTNGVIKSGDAFDCDVNNDGEFDPETERFYYVRSLNGNAVMLSSNNIVQTDMLYNDALLKLPKTDTWTNPDLVKFDDSRVGRFITREEISLGCGGIDVLAEKSLLKCLYTLDGTSFANPEGRRSSYMVEVGVDPSNGVKTYYRVLKGTKSVSVGNGGLVAAPRPAIEVPLEKVQGYGEKPKVVEYDTASAAVNNYYEKVTDWVGDKTTFLTAMKNNYESHDCKPTAIDPQVSTDFPVEFQYNTTGTQACDRQAGFDTGIMGDIKVYLSDEQTLKKGEEVTDVYIKKGVISNLAPGKVYRYEAAVDPETYGMIKTTGSRRLITLPTARNARDLGGIKAAGGKTIKYGQLLRGERLAEKDVTVLKSMGVDKEYDIREEDNGAHFKDGFERHAILNYDIIDEANYGGVRAALTSLMNDVIAGNSIYFHCTHGSDRTGTLAYLTEALLGVSDEDRNRDFDLTSLSGRADRNRYYDHMAQYTAGHNSNRKYVYMVTNLPTEEAVREWYFRGSKDRAADEKLIEDFKNAILE